MSTWSDWILNNVKTVSRTIGNDTFEGSFVYVHDWLNGERFQDDDFKVLREIDNLVGIEIHGDPDSQITDGIVEYIPFEKLHRLAIKAYGITDDFLFETENVRQAGAFSELFDFQLHSPSLTDQALTYVLSKWNFLKILSISSPFITRKSARALGQLEDLEVLLIGMAESPEFFQQDFKEINPDCFLMIQRYSPLQPWHANLSDEAIEEELRAAEANPNL